VHPYVNDEVRQSSKTREMIHNIYQQIAYLSTAFTLESCDLIATGPPRAGGGRNDSSRVPEGRSGDPVRCEIDNIGAIENRVMD
jgi:2-keto-4-pentenoate hydratase/2-oxohepta-3-ene-1,7-dioic acid hydratase in catechol pathway